MKRKIFEFGDDLAAAFEEFCGERGLVEKRVVESMVAYFMQQDAAVREKIMMTRYGSDTQQPPLRVAAKPVVGPKYGKPIGPPKSTPIKKPKD